MTTMDMPVQVTQGNARRIATAIEKRNVDFQHAISLYPDCGRPDSYMPFLQVGVYDKQPWRPGMNCEDYLKMDEARQELRKGIVVIKDACCSLGLKCVEMKRTIGGVLYHYLRIDNKKQIKNEWKRIYAEQALRDPKYYSCLR